MSASAPGPYLARIFPVPSARAVQLLCAYGLFQALLLVFMPGAVFHGPVTAGGNRPVYKARSKGDALQSRLPWPRRADPARRGTRQANGVQCMVATFAVYFALLRCAPRRPSAPRRRAAPVCARFATAAHQPLLTPAPARPPAAAPGTWTPWRCTTCSRR